MYLGRLRDYVRNNANRLAVMSALLFVPVFFDAKTVMADTDVITRVDFGTVNDFDYTFDEYQYIDQPDIYIKSVSSVNGTVKASDLEFDDSEYYGWCCDDGTGTDDYYSYRTDGVQGLYFTSGESRLMTDVFVKNTVSGVRFSDDCEFVFNGVLMNTKSLTSDEAVNYIPQTARHISEKDVIEEIELENIRKKPCAGMLVKDARPFYRVKNIKLKSGRKADGDLINFINDNGKVVWEYFDDYSSKFKTYSNLDSFYAGSNRIKMTIDVNDKLINGYKLASNLKVKSNYRTFECYDNTLGDYTMIVSSEFNAYNPEISVFTRGEGSDNEVSFNGENYDSSYLAYYSYGSSITMYAKASEGYRLVEWKNESDEVVGNSTSITVSVTSDESYYAVFEKVLPTEGILNDTVKYTFNKATGTVTLIPTGEDGKGSISYYGWNNSPFYKNGKIRRVIINEGITGIGNYVFSYNNLEYVKIPASIILIDERAFEDCYLCGDGFDISDENEMFTSLDGSLASKNGKILYKFFQKKGITEYSIPDGVKEISRQCFEAVKLSKLTLKNEGLMLYDYALDGTIDHIYIEEGVKELGNYSTWDTLDTSIYIPASVQQIGSQSMFAGSSKVANVYVSEDSPYYKSIGGVLYKKTDDGLVLIKYPAGKKGTSFTTPAGVVGIGFCAVTNSNLISITLSKDVKTLDSFSIRYLNNAKIKVLNPDCEFIKGWYNDAIDSCNNTTICGIIGSTAQVFADAKNYPFEIIGENNGKLATPTNLRWDGNVARWDKVDNTVRYNVVLYRDTSGDGSYSEFKSFNVDGDLTEYDFSVWLWQKTTQYKFTVKATAPYYEVSDVAESESRDGRYSQGLIKNMRVDGDTMTFEGCLDDDGDELSYFGNVYDKENNYITRIALNPSEKNNLRSLFYAYSISTYGEYKISVIAYVNGMKTDGYSIEYASSSGTVTYDFEKVSPISKICLSIPEPEVGANATVSDLNIEAYCGDELLDSIYVQDGPYNSYYQYKETEASSWLSFDDNVITKGKYAFKYFVNMAIRGGYTLADDVEIFVNGEDVNVLITDRGSSYLYVEYYFPIGVKAFEYVKTVTVTGDYKEPKVGEDIVNPTNVAVSEEGLKIRDAYWIAKDGDEWKIEKLTGKFEAGKEYAIYVEVAADEDNDYRIASYIDSHSVFADTEATCVYSSGLSIGYYKVVGKAESVEEKTETGKTDVTSKDKPKEEAKQADKPKEENKKIDFETSKKVKILSLKNKAKRKLLVKWKKYNNASGYEVCYSLKKKFPKTKKAKTTIKDVKSTKITIKNLKKKKIYYVRIRAYSLDATGKKIYSKWSKVKKLKIKK